MQVPSLSFKRDTVEDGRAAFPKHQLRAAQGSIDHRRPSGRRSSGLLHYTSSSCERSRHAEAAGKQRVRERGRGRGRRHRVAHTPCPGKWLQSVYHFLTSWQLKVLLSLGEKVTSDIAL